MTSTRLTMAGAAISLAILFMNLRPWWRGNRAWKTLAPFAGYVLLGAVSTMCAGGLLGWLAGCAATGVNGTGARAVPGVTGQQTAALAHGSLGALTPGGGVVVFLAAIAAGATWKAASTRDRKRMLGGGLVGCSLTLTAGVADLLSWLPVVVNGAGSWLQQFLDGAFHL